MCRCPEALEGCEARVSQLIGLGAARQGWRRAVLQRSAPSQERWLWLGVMMCRDFEGSLGCSGLYRVGVRSGGTCLCVGSGRRAKETV